MIKLYNTLTRQKEKFQPIEKNKVKMYVCGPTVYDVPHIGHARSAYCFEIIRRYFEYRGFAVLFVRNITDVDDKIIKKAARELGGKDEELSGDQLKKKVAEVAACYLDAYHREMKGLGIRPPDCEPKATENIGAMIKFVELLINKGFAYVAAGDVYFSVEKFPEYGKLSGQDKEQLMHGVRVDAGVKKKHKLDFALWKESKPGEPSWPSPWGSGRPGWHIECSVMSTNLLGPEFDIHGGGLDLIFPHHENEIAQSESATGKAFANYWIHNGLLTVNGEKMSKSLGNYITVSDFLKKHEDTDLLKIIFLNSHYRSPVDYSGEKVEEAAGSKERIMIFLDKAERLVGVQGQGSRVKGQERRIKELINKFEKAMDDDFNTPVAFSVIFEAVGMGNECISGKKTDDEKASMAGALRDYILKSARLLGLSLKAARVKEKEAEKIERLIAERENARKNKKYAESDKIRQKLNEMGITIEDTPKGTVWRKN